VKVPSGLSTVTFDCAIIVLFIFIQLLSSSNVLLCTSVL